MLTITIRNVRKKSSAISDPALPLWQSTYRLQSWCFLLHRSLKSLSCRELWCLPRSNLYLLTSLRISPFSCLSLCDRERTETDKRDLIPLLQGFLHTIDK